MVGEWARTNHKTSLEESTGPERAPIVQNRAIEKMKQYKTKCEICINILHKMGQGTSS